ncbi:MAG: malto-oligosyltrehalose synthase, partial [Gemmatimonadaceae bacterium]
MTRLVTATYRLQLRREFPLSAARERVRYFERLGVSHLYLSPVLAARRGSAHGYDVIDPTRVNPELGTEDDLRGLAADLHEAGMGIILDIVPNHMAASEQNPYWDNVLERGLESRYAEWFDIDWEAPRVKNRVQLPVLGDEFDKVLERGELKLHVRDSGSRIAYFDKTFPLDPATLPKEVQLAQWDPSGRGAAEEWASGAAGRERLRELLDTQHYRLVFWRRGAEINYRRFFDINDLVGVRVESESVCEATHRLVFDWIRDGVLDGLRIDHVDGLRDPAAYLARLRERVDALRHADAPARVPIVVEKILSGDEELPRSWPVDGTTGYDFMTDVEDLFLDAAGYAAIEANYRALRHNPEMRFRAIAHEGKRRALKGPLASDVLRTARLARAWRPTDLTVQEIGDAIVELIVRLEVYRTYVSTPGVLDDADSKVLERALAEARAAGDVNTDALQLIEDAFRAPPSPGDAIRAELVARIQQTSGPATAKGVEDTALYIYVPLASRNEVGGEPDRPLENASARVHERNAKRARDWSRTLLATDTHDTKRSADLRARLGVLTTMPDEWARHVSRWRRLNKSNRQVIRGRLTPDTNAEYLYYQTVFGMWPAPRPQRRADDLPSREWLEAARQRLVEYMRKAAREAKTRTSWREIDPQYENALLDFVSRTLTPQEETHFLPDLARLTARAAMAGFQSAIARVMLQFTSPGIPDIYQGSELWSFTLVDPDNRRPVDFDLRAKLLDEMAAPDADGTCDIRASLQPLPDNRAKLALVARLLRVRRDHPSLFTEGDYVPLVFSGASAQSFAFSRRWQNDRCMVIARTRFGWEGSEEQAARLLLSHDLAGRWTSVLTSRSIDL